MPKSLALLEDQLSRLRLLLSVNAWVVAGAVLVLTAVILLLLGRRATRRAALAGPGDPGEGDSGTTAEGTTADTVTDVASTSAGTSGTPTTPTTGGRHE